MAIGAVVILGAILGPTALTHPPASPNGSQVAAHPSSGNGPGQTASATAGPELWDELDVPPFEATAALAADDQDRLGIGANSTFTLRSLTSTPAVELARGLHVEPAIKLAVEPGASPDVALVRAASPLVEGVRYRFVLDAPDGALTGSWAFTTRAPLHVVQTLPGDRDVAVPGNTGIEVTFDQDGTRGVEDRFTIEPAVTGRFEQHDRTWAFVPATSLAPATIYKVTVRAGVGVTDSTETLESDVTFRFETAASSTTRSRLFFGRPMLETRPGDRPVAPVVTDDYDERGSSLPDSITVDVHRLADFGAVVDAAIALAGPDSWAISSPTAVVDTSKLTLVGRVDGKVVNTDAGEFLRLPFEPSAGGYVVTIVQPGAPAQLLLQVTDLATYALTAEQNTVVWVNDLASDAAIAGATVGIARGSSLGATDTAGILRVKTPAELKATPSSYDAPLPRFIAVRAPDGRRLVVPVGLRTDRYEGGYEGDYGFGDDSAHWWLLFRTDRDAYRQTDTIYVYGMVRARSDRSVPDRLELRLRPVDGPVEAPIKRVAIHATERGVFTGSIHYENLPRGQYNLDLFVGTKRVSSAWVNVIEIRKPAFRIDVETGRHVYLLGQQVEISMLTSSYDGTPLPGIDLQVSAFDQHATATSGELGDATATLRAASSYVPDGWFYDYVGVAPAHPEEGQIEGTVGVVLLPSRAWLTGTGSVNGDRVVVDGTLTWADIKGMEATLAAGGSLDYENDGPGRPISSGTIRARVIHLVPVRTQVGTQYDFIEKRVLPVYEYDVNEVSLGTSTLTSARDGSFHLSVPAPVASDEYEIILTTTDPEGRRFQRTVYASAPVHAEHFQRPYLNTAGYCGYTPQVFTGVDEAFTVAMHEGSGELASGGRFLFIVSEAGSLETTVQDAATFSRTLRDADLPGFTVRAVWLSGGRYAVADAETVVNRDDKRLTITLTPDRARYRPGQHARIAITTKDPSGRPVAADVVVQGVDEKLYGIGLANDMDPVQSIMASRPDGFLQSYTTHAVPASGGDGCGAAGGGDREDFRDAVTFQRITTDADGRGAVEFDLSDDLTSWHMTATAFSARLDSGIGSVLLPVGLPFFVDAVLAPEYLVGEDPVLRARAFGGALAAGTPIRFAVEAPSLGLSSTTVKGAAFDAVRIPLPKLIAGDHAIRISAEATISGRTYKDALVRTIHVASSRLDGLAPSYDLLDAGYTPRGGEGLTTYAITDAGRGRLLRVLQELAWDRSGRFDKVAAAEVARRLLIDEFGFSPARLPASGFDGSRYEHDGLALLSYGTSDLFLSARAALTVPTLLSRDQLADALRSSAADDQATRERTIVALAGLAGIGEDVLAQLRAYDPGSLTVREQLWLALGLAAAGDEDAARAIERSLLEAAGQRLGPWVRLTTGTTLDNTLEASGLLLLLAGRLGDPLSHEVSRYLAEVESRERVFPLEQIGYVTGMLDRLSRTPGRFAWTVAGDRHEVELRPGGAYTLVLTSEQRATLSFERLDGELAVVSTWSSSETPLPTGGSVQIRRTVTPADNAGDDHLVRVRIEVTFGTQAAPGCYRLTDLTPSGLSAISPTAGWPDEESASTDNGPYEITGQRVSWCASPEDRSHIYAYAARVVSPGTYRWEPAVVQYELSPGLGASTPETTFTIN